MTSNQKQTEVGTKKRTKRGSGSSGLIRIAIVGTFDVSNFGDLLFPLLAERELSKRLTNIELIPYSYREMSDASWPYRVRSLDGFAEEIMDFDLVLIGGGHLI